MQGEERRHFRRMNEPTFSTSFETEDGVSQPMEAHVMRHVRALFDRLPGLEKFRLDGNLTLADVSVAGSSNRISGGRMHVIVMQALVELAECDAEALMLMRDRTFLRRH
jgi:hypothetical protein